MFRYVAFAWNAGDSGQADAAHSLSTILGRDSPELHTVYDRPGLTVTCAGGHFSSIGTCPLQPEGGVVLGTLFRKSEHGGPEDGRCLQVAEPESRRIVASAGRHLVDRYWGRYVAFLQDTQRRRTWVLRDPAGGVLCYMTAYRGLHLFFSNMDDSVGRLLHPSIDWESVAVHVIIGPRPAERTPLKGVTEVQIGQCIDISPDTLAKHRYWNPADISCTDVPENPAEAARALRAAAKACAHAWASCHPRILLCLSGGLDSSVVLGCLREAPAQPNITCLNNYSSEAESDERPFARLAARSAGCRLIEERRPMHGDFRELLRMTRSVRPGFYLGLFGEGRRITEVGHEIGATAVYDGSGGDELFYENHVRYTAVDYLARHGVDRAFLKIVRDIAQLENTSIWHILRETVLLRLSERRWNPTAEVLSYRDLVRAECRNTLERYAIQNNWLESDARVPPGKRWHIRTSVGATALVDPLGQWRDMERISPLRSQPVVEVCLRIPTYWHASDGWSRALARRAFAADVPREILQRHLKGGVDGYVKRLLFANIQFVRELLLDGLLIREGLLDRRKLADTLSGRTTRGGAEMAEVFDHLSTEAWLRTWIDRSYTLAA